MTATELLRKLRAAGRKVCADGDHVRITGSAPLEPDLRDLVRQHKPELLLLLQPGRPLTSPPVPEALGWTRLRELGANLGASVTDGGKTYQLWGITPRGAICFDGTVLRTLDPMEVSWA